MVLVDLVCLYRKLSVWIIFVFIFILKGKFRIIIEN